MPETIVVTPAPSPTLVTPTASSGSIVIGTQNAVGSVTVTPVRVVVLRRGSRYFGRRYFG